MEEQIKKCGPCQRNKTSRHAPYGKLMPNPAPREAWKEVIMDFIMKLPKSKEPGNETEYNTIMTIVNRLTKYVYFVPIKEEMSAEELVYVFVKTIVGNHKIPERIISDRDKWFTSKFWGSFINYLGIKHKLSTAYHPQTDGQTKRLNAIAEEYIRHYANY